jgi:hypothetical protein
MDNLRTGEKIAGISGIALLLIMFIFDWFSVDAGGGAFEVSVGGNAWDTMEWIRWVLLLAALSGIALALIAATRTDIDLPVAMSAITAGLGILATILVLYRIIDPPGGDAEEFGVEINRSIGVFLGLIASAGVAYGGWRAMQEEGTSYDSRTTAPPPPSPPPSPSQSGGPPPA